MVYKMNESIIVIQAEATSPNRTNVVFWSHDRGTAKLRMKLVRKNGIPQSLPEGTTVPIRLMFRSATAEGGYGKHDYLATVEDPVNGIVSIVLEDNILGYVGTVEGSVYIDFPDDRSLDTAGRFTFDIKRSPIDDSTPELEDYYFNGFSQTIDKIEKILADGKQEIEKKVAESETQIDAKVKDTNDKITKANQDVATLNTNIDKANDRIDQTNQQIGDLGKLKKIYSNSIDFGNYDYSGNPNLSAKLNDSSFSSGTGATVADDNDEIVFTLDGTNQLSKYATRAQTPLIEGKQYTISCEIMLETGFTGDPSGIRLQHAYLPGGNVVLQTATVPKNELNKWQKLIGTQTVKYTSDAPNEWYPLFRDIRNLKPTGKVRLRKIKIEEGPTSTPYQPNLLDAPYYLSKVALGENIADPTKTFPIKTRAYLVYSGANTEPYIAGQQYTLTMKATKPVTQTFNVFLNAGTIGFGSMTPVEGLTDVWQKTVTVGQDLIDAGVKDRLTIYQVPNSSVGDVQIDWLKIEKGNTRTPNISQFKYFGEGLKDSNNPNDYSWDVTPEYAEKGLNDSVSLTKPQSVDGTKNFLETPLVNGKNVLVEEKPLPYEAWHSTGTEQTGISNKARLIIGPVATTIGAKLNRSMKENPLTWNSGNWQATANRDCTLLVEGLVRYQFGGSTAGQYGYITFYKDDAQTSSIGFAGGVGINGTALQWKHGLHFSRIFALKKGEYFNITFETQDGKKLDFSQINTLHIMEIES
ncbi:BppU family phage baseplate upper protein [Enterococcus faecium]|uniref:BppU family phage baseplate upper protein n=1 Tax=Enterococcus faecium TaxID=1352 RepID=UPI00115F1DC0|nr:BppU family phage baseplate upper protein [Enterococcus faecium]MDG4579480.1 BppU family phage baseplate upper protein [Enterococcus faecium]